MTDTPEVVKSTNWRDGRYPLDWPTLLVMAATYAGWFALTWHFHALPWYVLLVFGSILVAWHGSLRHEACHGNPISPKVAFLLVSPPIGLIEPFALYRESHLKHHNDESLTIPGEDPETYYFSREEWARKSAFMRGLYLFNQTYLGRMLIGPGLYVCTFFKAELGRFLSGDFSHAKAWAIHVPWLAAVLYWVVGVCDIPFWQYVLLMAYPGTSLGMTRSYYEHRYDEDPHGRVAIVDEAPFFTWLFLHNNLHVPHHEQPHLPWYTRPKLYQQNKERYQAMNHGYVFHGYPGLIRQFLFKPTFYPVHPETAESEEAAIDEEAHVA